MKMNKTNIAFAAAALVAVLTGGAAHATDNNATSASSETTDGFENMALDLLLSGLTNDTNAAASAVGMAVKNQAIAKYALPKFQQIIVAQQVTPAVRGILAAGIGKIAQRFPVFTDDARLALQNAQKAEKDPQVQEQIRHQLDTLKKSAQMEHPTVPEQLKPLPPG